MPPRLTQTAESMRQRFWKTAPLGSALPTSATWLTLKSCRKTTPATRSKTARTAMYTKAAWRRPPRPRQQRPPQAPRRRNRTRPPRRRLHLQRTRPPCQKAKRPFQQRFRRPRRRPRSRSAKPIMSISIASCLKAASSSLSSQRMRTRSATPR